MASKSKIKPIFYILILAVVLRLIVVNQSLWLDEAIGAIAVKQFSYSELISKLLVVDNHPPLYYFLLKAWTDIWGYSELALRSLSILFSLIAIYYTYKLTNLFTSNKYSSMFVSFFLATSQFFVYYSQEARMYMPATGLSVFAVYYFLRTFEKKSKNHFWYLFSVGLTGLLFMDYVPVFIYPVFWIVAFIKKPNKNWWIKYLAAHMPLAVLGFVWLPIFLQQSQNSPYVLKALPNWKDVAGGANFKQASLLWIKFTSGRISLFNKKAYYLYSGLSSLPFLYAIKNKIFSKKLFVNNLFLVFPIITLFLASIFFPAFIYFRLTYIFPFFAILIAISLFNKKNNYFLASLIILLNIVSLLIYYTDQNQQREQWKQAVQYIESNAEKDSLAIFEYPKPFSPYRWYENGSVESEGALLKVNASVDGTQDYIDEVIGNRNTIYHFEYLRDLSDSQRLVEERLQKRGFQITAENANFVGVGKITKWQLSQ